jgi:hypothetical protein
MADARVLSRAELSPDHQESGQHRVELTGWCWRVPGSTFEAEDSVQETSVRERRSLDWLEGACRGSRLVPTMANGLPAFGQYRPSGPDGRHERWALPVIHVEYGRIAELSLSLDAERMSPISDLPMQLDHA